MNLKSRLTIKKETLKKWAKRLLLSAVLFVLLLLITFFVADYLSPFPSERLSELRENKQGTLILDRHGEVLHGFVGEDDSLLYWTELENISPYLQQATIAVEDADFYSHNGLDPKSIIRALANNIIQMRRTSGASTITMQLCRQLYLYPRNLRAKAYESFRAIQAERIYTKDEILEQYLNLIPYGGNLIGIEAASRFYFQKSANDLSISEAALLAGIPQRPAYLRPDRYPQAARKRRNFILSRMCEEGYISNEQYNEAYDEEVVLNIQENPQHALHLCDHLKAIHPDQSIIKSSIDLRLQKLAKSNLRQELNTLKNDNINNAAMVIIDNKTAEILAMHGSADYFDESIDGQVNICFSKRSPGSTLKPFTFALAYQEGLISPAKKLSDNKRIYKNYAPKNFDQHFQGAIRADEALSQSLNLPALYLLENIGIERLYYFLNDCNIKFPKSPTHYGLSLTLGSGEVRLIDLANAYGIFSREGKYLPYKLLMDQPSSPVKQVIDPAVSYLISESLADHSHSNILLKGQNSNMKVSWKTGTSWGNRDAWTVAYTKDYTIAVWLGNANGESSKSLIGAKVAAPFAIRLMQLLYGPKSPQWIEKPKSIKSRDVCAISGMCLGKDCKLKVSEEYIPGLSPNELCLLKNHEQKERIANKDKRRLIQSPVDGQVYYLEKNAINQKLKFSADSETQYWFLNGKFIEKKKDGEAFYLELKPGRHQISCVNELGESESIEIQLKALE